MVCRAGPEIRQASVARPSLHLLEEEEEEEEVDAVLTR